MKLVLKKYKGFTLIELLAVIIILAIVALITIPIILNVINDARISSGNSEASMILSGINSYCATSAIKEKLDGTVDICADGVTIEEVSQMVNLGNATVNKVTYSDGKVTNLIVESNNHTFTLCGTENFVVDDEKCLIENSNILLKDINYKDDNYLFSGEVYYLNPYDLDMLCQNGSTNASENKNECMTWYEISEDDKYVTLILNSNLGDPIEETNPISETAISYLNTLTSNWDSRLSFPNNTIIDGYDFSNAKARILSAYEIANIMSEPDWNKDKTDFNFDYALYLKENLDSETWYQGGFFTITPYDDNRNYVVNKYGLDISMADGYTNGVRPVVVVEKQFLDTYHNKLPNKQNLVTYLSTRMITVDDNAAENAIRYQVSKMRAAGIGRAYLNVGKIELVDENGILLENRLESYYLEHQENIGRWIKIAQEYGVEIVPWINYSMERDFYETAYDENQTWGDIAIQALTSYVEKIFNVGYLCDGVYYKATEIHYDAEPTRASHQPYYLETIKAIREVIKEDINFSASTAAGKVYDEEFIRNLSQYLDEFDVMVYDSMGPDDGEVVTKDDYIRYINETIDNYKNGTSGTEARFIMIGPMYEDTYYETENSWPYDDGKKYSHMNFYQGEEVETMRVFIEAIKKNNLENIEGIGFYNWNSFTYADSVFNTSDYVNEDYNQKTVIEYILKNWVY